VAIKRGEGVNATVRSPRCFCALQNSVHEICVVFNVKEKYAQRIATVVCKAIPAVEVFNGSGESVEQNSLGVDFLNVLNNNANG